MSTSLTRYHKRCWIMIHRKPNYIRNVRELVLDRSRLEKVIRDNGKRWELYNYQINLAGLLTCAGCIIKNEYVLYNLIDLINQHTKVAYCHKDGQLLTPYGILYLFKQKNRFSIDMVLAYNSASDNERKILVQNRMNRLSKPFRQYLTSHYGWHKYV